MGILITKDILSEKLIIQQAVDNRDSEIRDLALKIHANPELGFKEYKAAEWITNTLEKAGFKVEKGVANIETAFVATWEGSSEGPTIAFIAEYDALPELGHGCGHNIIASSSVGAALAIKDAFPNFPGTIKVIGTPAEEGGGGKIIMCEHGVFDDLDAAMMCHPLRDSLAYLGGLAAVNTTFKFYGKESHAAFAPEDGISALDAVINSFNAINSLRQFFTDDVRIHGIITKGGDASNVVPAYCEAKFGIRASTRKRLELVKEKVYNAVRHSTAAVGAKCEIEEGLVYAERNDNLTMADLFKDNLESMGVQVKERPKQGGIASSDIGNVSQIVPTVQSYIKIGDAPNHTPEFTRDSGSERGMVGLNQAAKALAMTAYDLAVDPEILKNVKEEFENSKKVNN
ncbi:M20 family metallopeptidase [Ureibacillus acetophenoni]|uniref:M20 family metallopeptidase n=1 Tax=Ureibacillus acetophenoni TaxID=614649 RepID=UPI0038B477E5